MTKLLRILQWSAIALQIAEHVQHSVNLPPKWDVPVHGAILIGQGALHELQKNFNPDGTPATVAYQK